MATAPTTYNVSAADYAEALRLAKAQFDGQDTTASLPGGLEPSVYKVQIVELLTTGKKWDPLATCAVRTLSSLINHFQYGLSQPALVVSVTPRWVKIACYSSEHDGIVVVGLPTKAIALVAPKTPGQKEGEEGKVKVGQRLITVCQFYGRCTCTNATHTARQGVLGDIVMGPRTYDRWYNFHPLIAQFLTDDKYAPIWEERAAEFPEWVWDEMQAGWEAWKARHGENYFRLGTVETAGLISTQHPV